MNLTKKLCRLPAKLFLYSHRISEIIRIEIKSEMFYKKYPKIAFSLKSYFQHLLSIMK